jgi:SGNH domain-containing protein
MLRGRRALVGFVAVAALAAGVGAPAAVAGPTTTTTGGSDKPTVLLVGDSLSENIAEGLLNQGKVNAVDGGVVNCTVTKGVLQGYKNQILYSGCQNWETDWPAKVAQYNPDIVVIVTGGWEIVNRWFGGPSGPPLTIKDPTFANNYLAALDHAAELLSANGAKVVALTTPYMDPPHPYPEAGSGPLTEIWWEPYGPTDPPPEWVAPTPDTPFVSGHDKVDAANQVIRAFGREGNAKVFDLNKLLGPGGKYREKVKGKFVRFEDKIHLSPDGEKLVAKWLAKKLLKLAKSS